MVPRDRIGDLGSQVIPFTVAACQVDIADIFLKYVTITAIDVT
jgi:hypothetical protein